jgi:hypothetical protein
VALENLALCWHHIPLLLTMGVLDVFFLYLDENKVPTTSEQSADASLVGRALTALSALGMTPVLDFETRKAYSKDMIQAWPGIFTSLEHASKRLVSQRKSRRMSQR